MIKEGYLKTTITPKKTVLIEGEIFEADVYFASCSVYTGNNLHFKVNGQLLDKQNGFARFKGKNETVGSKIIKAEAILTNPFTSEKSTTEASFEYQVLPKCSRDCQYSPSQ